MINKSARHLYRWDYESSSNKVQPNTFFMTEDYREMIKIGFWNSIGYKFHSKFRRFWINVFTITRLKRRKIQIKERNVNSFCEICLKVCLQSVWEEKKKKKCFENRCLPCHRRPSWPVDGRLWDEGAVVDASFLHALPGSRSVKQKDKNS